MMSHTSMCLHSAVALNLLFSRHIEGEMAEIRWGVLGGGGGGGGGGDTHQHLGKSFHKKGANCGQ